MDGIAVQSGPFADDTRWSRTVLLGVIGVAVVIAACVFFEGLARGGGTQPGPGVFVVGLAARRGSDRSTDIERLADALRQFTARLEDGSPRAASEPSAPSPAVDEPIDVGIDRDDELGRLSETVTDLTAAVCDRERRRAEREQYRRELSRLTSDPNTDDGTTIRRLLELGCDRLGLETGFVSRFDETAERYEIEAAVGHETDLEGTVLHCPEPCDDLLESDAVQGPTGAAVVEWGDHPIAEELDGDCQLGGRIVVDGDYCGTVCFLDREPRKRPFTPAETSFVEVIARWMSQTFERRTYVQRIRERERRLDRAQAFTDDMLDAVDDVVYLLDEDGTVRRWNESLCEVTGYTDAEIDEMHALAFFDEADHDRITDAITEVLETGSTRLDAPIVTSDGQRRPYEFVASTLENPAGERVIAGVGRDIGERLAKQQRLERYEQFTRNVIDALDDVFYVLDADGSLQRWNETLVEVSGYTDAEIAEMHALDFFTGDDRTVIRESIDDAFETGETCVEAALQTSTGEKIPYEFTASVLEDPDGNPVEVGIGRDISERNATERRLREREARLERTTQLLEQAQRLANVGAWELDVTEDPPALRWTDEVYRIFGRSPDQAVDLEWVLDHLPPADQDRLTEVLDRAIEDGAAYDIETRIITADGDQRWIRSIGEPVRDDGEIVAIRGAAQDITPRKEREHELERAETIIQALDEVVYTIDADGTFQFVNDALTQITGYEPEALLGEHVSTVMADEDIETAQDRIRDLLSESEPSETFEMVFETVDGEPIDVENHMALLPMADGEFAGTAGVIRDITERKERQRDLRETKRRLELTLEGTNTGVWEWDLDDDTVSWNEPLERLVGLEPGEFGGTFEAVRQRLHPDDVAPTETAVQQAIENDELFQTEFRFRHEDGGWIWVGARGRVVDDGDGTRMVGINNDITERKTHETELERTTELLEQAERLASIGGWELDVSTDPPDVVLTDGLRRLYELPSDAAVGPERAASFPHPADRETVHEAVDAALEAGESYDIEHRTRTATGNERWVRSIGEPVRTGERPDADGSHRTDDIVGVRGTIQDITEQKEHEFALESLHGAARDLLGTDSEAEVAELVVETAADILEAAGVAVYHLDADVNRFEPLAHTDAFARLCDDTASVAVGDTDAALWNVYVTGTGMVIDDPASFDQSRIFGSAVDSGVVVPIGDHGVFAVASGGEPIDATARRLIETLVATTEAAFDRLESEASLRERETELEERNRRLSRHVSITELIRRIDQSLIGADSRDEIEATVPERLIEVDDVAFAWIGQFDASGTRLEPRAWAGSGQEYLDDISVAAETSAEPAVRTARTETPTVVSNVVDGLQREDWRRPALDRGFQSVISVPLSHAEYSYGVLTLYADEPDAFADLEQTVVTELGDGIANAINAVNTREALHAERTLELTLQLEGTDNLLSRIAAKTGGTVDYAGLGTHSGDETLLFVETSGVSADEVQAALDDLVSVTDFRLISETEHGCRFEATVAGEVIASRLVRHGGSPRSMHADATGTEITVDVPTGTDVREFVEMLREEYPTAELQARRDVERSMRTRTEHVTSLLDALTDRQLEVLRTAYFAGFFEWPRESTGEEIAALLEVTQPTVNRHLRIGQQRLLAQLFEEAGPISTD